MIEKQYMFFQQGRRNPSDIKDIMKWFSERCDYDDITYFQSFGYLMTIAFTIGYGHITPPCPGGKVRVEKRKKQLQI